MSPENQKRLAHAAERADKVVLPKIIEVIKGEPGMVAVAACINAIRHASNCQSTPEGLRALILLVRDEMQFNLNEIDATPEVAKAIEEASGNTQH